MACWPIASSFPSLSRIYLVRSLTSTPLLCTICACFYCSLVSINNYRFVYFFVRLFSWNSVCFSLFDPLSWSRFRRLSWNIWCMISKVLLFIFRPFPGGIFLCFVWFFYKGFFAVIAKRGGKSFPVLPKIWFLKKNFRVFRVLVCLWM